MPKTYREVLSLSLKKNKGNLKKAHAYRKDHYRRAKKNTYIRRYRRVEKAVLPPSLPPTQKRKANQNEYETTKYYKYDEKTFQVRVVHTVWMFDPLHFVNSKGERFCDLAFEEKIGAVGNWENWSVGSRTLRKEVFYSRPRYIVKNMRTNAIWRGVL